MKYTVKWSGRFKKSYKLAKKRGLDINLLRGVISSLSNGVPLEKKYEDHPLSGKYKGYRECHIQPDWLLIYLIENEILTLTLVDTGTHADLFGM